MCERGTGGEDEAGWSISHDEGGSGVTAAACGPVLRRFRGGAWTSMSSVAAEEKRTKDRLGESEGSTRVLRTPLPFPLPVCVMGNGAETDASGSLNLFDNLPALGFADSFALDTTLRL